VRRIAFAKERKEAANRTSLNPCRRRPALQYRRDHKHNNGGERGEEAGERQKKKRKGGRHNLASNGGELSLYHHP